MKISIIKIIIIIILMKIKIIIIIILMKIKIIIET